MANVLKRKSLSVDAKVQIINAVAKGEKKKDVAARFGIPVNSLSTILKGKENILAAVAAGTSTTRKRLKVAHYDDVDKATFTWFLEMLASRVPLTGAIVVLCGESLSADVVGAATWQEEELKGILEKYQPKDIYNADETALFYQMMPGRTLTLKGRRCEGGTQSKQRFSVLFCVNMDSSDKRLARTLTAFEEGGSR
ncbi:tigger transposable element-derived protein 6-like [Ornithodoros turicata]|uniref:tigger transposable element-derived protein 6-like n=1 Tax=Ornithodoros turicata TaxID=34597 RepID=UPI003139E48A